MINLHTLASLVKVKPAPKAVEPPIEKIADEKLSRRAALRRIGMIGGMAVLGTLSIDDLARVSAKKLEQNELTRGIAKDFRSAGVAFADVEQGSLGGESMAGRPRRPRIPKPASCSGGAANCEDCMADYLAACQEKASRGGNVAGLEVCRHAENLCVRYCYTENASGFATCYQNATRNI